MWELVEKYDERVMKSFPGMFVLFSLRENENYIHRTFDLSSLGFEPTSGYHMPNGPLIDLLLYIQPNKKIKVHASSLRDLRHYENLSILRVVFLWLFG